MPSDDKRKSLQSLRADYLTTGGAMDVVRARADASACDLDADLKKRKKQQECQLELIKAQDSNCTALFAYAHACRTGIEQFRQAADLLGVEKLFEDGVISPGNKAAAVVVLQTDNQALLSLFEAHKNAVRLLRE